MVLKLKRLKEIRKEIRKIQQKMNKHSIKIDVESCQRPFQSSLRSNSIQTEKKMKKINY